MANLDMEAFMKKTARRQFAMNTLYSVAAIGFGLGMYEGKAMPFLLALLAYGCGHYLARLEDMNK